ncbi:hypothetical protein O6H91_18G052500 [Diphasiastrum complanatum]|uniref:Uncharacterized protein n=1 Tax=Diphasiastrum complanatum TaxID=34168 RepID=A0ACC2B157_DIPCM|nr:hypothetical protein O6H91_18G052500 [Diphasiastrum complanatum]
MEWTQLGDGNCRGAAKRSPKFCRFMLEMLTEQEDVVIDLFASTGNFPKAAAAMNHHCICVENTRLFTQHFWRSWKTSLRLIPTWYREGDHTKGKSRTDLGLCWTQKHFALICMFCSYFILWSLHLEDRR